MCVCGVRVEEKEIQIKQYGKWKITKLSVLDDTKNGEAVKQSKMGPRSLIFKMDVKTRITGTRGGLASIKPQQTK